MNINYCSPSFHYETRLPLKDYTTNGDNIRQAKSRMNELQKIINELNRSQNIQNARKSISPLRKSPARLLTPPPQMRHSQKSQKSLEKKHTPVSPCFKGQKENKMDLLIMGLVPDQLIDKDFESYEMTKMLGLGSYAVVKLAQRNGVNVAIKTYEKSKLNDQQKKKNVSREIKILSKLRHQNIIKLVGVNESCVQLHLIMEYFSQTSLNSFIKAKPQRKLNEYEARIIFRQIIEAVRYCHHKNVVHRDIKLENILIDHNNQIKLIDFGFSIAIDPATKLSVFCGTPSYMAPEIVNKQSYSFPADVWALGILLYKMVTGIFPFRGVDDKELYRKINISKLEFPPFLSFQIRNLLTKLLRQDQYERLTLKEIIQDEWLLS